MGDFKCFLGLSGSKVDDLQPFLFSIVHRIGRPAAILGQIADVQMKKEFWPQGNT